MLKNINFMYILHINIFHIFLFFDKNNEFITNIDFTIYFF